MRNAQDDPIARTVAENMIGDLFADNGHSTGDRDSDVAAARGLLATVAKSVEFETTSRKVGDQDVPLRRLVITGLWEVDPSAGR